MEQILAVFTYFFADARLHILLGLIVLDFALGVTQSIREQRVEWAKLAQFYGTNLAPKVLGYLLLYVTFGLLPGISGILEESLVSVAFGVIAAEQAGSIYGHLRAIGLKPGDK